jgi:hypothetical protein
MGRTTTHVSGDATFRTLSYVFRVRWDAEEVGAFARSVFGRFAAPLEEVVSRAPDAPEYVFISGASSYLLLFDGETFLESGDLRDLLQRFSWHVNTTAMRTCRDLLLVHAGAVVTPSGSGVLLPAASGSGKTSLAAGLVRAGWGYLSDEVGAIDPVTLELCPYPRVLSIKPGMFQEFADFIAPDQGWPISSREWLIAPEALRRDPVVDRSAVRFIVFLEHAPNVATRLTPLSPASSVTAMFEHVSNHQVWGGRALTILADVVRDARSYSLRTGRPDDAVRSLVELASRDA